MRHVSSVSKQKRDLNQWYKDIKKQLTSKAHENYFKRLQEITRIANSKLCAYDTKLDIDKEARAAMWNGIANDIDSWKGVEITACTKQKTTYKSYAITSRNWWNRNKAKVYGNHFFFTIIFVHIKQVVYELDIREEKKSFVFVDVFDEILRAKIQFPQTRAQPIIPYQSFIQPNKFKYSAIELLKSNGIHWTGKNIEGLGIGAATDVHGDDDEEHANTSSTTKSVDGEETHPTNMQSQFQCLPTTISSRTSYYIKDKDRSLKVNNSFMDSLEILKRKLARRLVRHTRNHSPSTHNTTIKVKDEPLDELPASISITSKSNTSHDSNRPETRACEQLPPQVKHEKYRVAMPTSCKAEDPDINMTNAESPSRANVNVNADSSVCAFTSTSTNHSASVSTLKSPSFGGDSSEFKHSGAPLPTRVPLPSVPLSRNQAPTYQMNQTRATNVNISNIHMNVNPNIGIVLPNSVSDVQSLLSAVQMSSAEQCQPHHTNTTMQPVQQLANHHRQNNNNNQQHTVRQDLSALMLPNVNAVIANQDNNTPATACTHYGPSRGQSNSVSDQRYSPSSLPFNFQNAYCSVDTDPVSGQLVLSIHIPVT